MEDYGIDRRKRHHLCGEFAAMLNDVSNKLSECTSVDDLKNFLNFYCHPLYPEKVYIERHVYCDAKTVKDIFLSLVPLYINYMEHYIQVIKSMYQESPVLWVFSAPGEASDDGTVQISS